jgi:3',5'-nucleoside bisphosphate phosphatase
LAKADLHTHTTSSDGACAPSELLTLAVSKGLSTLAVTDHDTIEGFLKIRDEAISLPIELVSGVEITARYKKSEIHILAYFFDPENEDMLSMLRSQRKARLKRMKMILELISKKGIRIDIEEVIAQARGKNVGRPHLASLMIKKNYVGSISEAFIRYLSSDVLGDVRVDYVEIPECVEILSSAGGITSLAHPSVIGNPELVEEILALHIDGIECIHPSHNFDRQKTYIELAKQKNLLITGGSDFHGTGREYDPYFGIVTLSEKYLQSIKRMSQRRKEALI